MGYRSEVCLRIDKEAITKEQWAEVEKLWPNEIEEVTVTDNESYYHFYAEDVKWYEDCGYKDVDVVMNLIVELDDDEYGMLRVGESPGDIEEYGQPYDFEIYASTTITYH